MNSITIRTLRQNWPETEKRLLREKELVITRHSKPVAKLSVWDEKEASPRKKFSADSDIRWLNQVWKGKKPDLNIDQALERDRSEP